MLFSFALWAQPGHCSGAMNTAFVVLSDGQDFAVY